MGTNISSFDIFKKFSTAKTDLPVNQVNNVMSIPAESSNINDAAMLQPASQEISYVKTPAAKTGEKKLKTRILPNDAGTKFKVEMKKAAKLPEYAYRGMKGDPNANFYEYLSLGNIPYFIGGPMLAAVFAFGITKNNLQARASAITRTKQIAVGVALYYLGVELAKKAIDIPVKLFRGIDLNHPYENVVDCRAVSETGFSPKKIEYHKVPESADFTRWDLMYGDETKNNGKAVNEQFDKLAKKFGIDEDVQDSGATLKGDIKKLIVSSTGFKYMLTAPFVMLGVALSAQNKLINGIESPIWGDIGNGLLKNLKNMFKNIFDIKNVKFGMELEQGSAEAGKIVKGHLTSLKYELGLKRRASIAVGIIKENLITPMKESFKALWGTNSWKNNKLGKAIILTSAIAPILANLRILQLTSEKHNKFVDISEYISISKQKQKS